MRAGEVAVDLLPSQFEDMALFIHPSLFGACRKFKQGHWSVLSVRGSQ